MSIDFIAVDVRHERRIRLLFTNILDSGAFGVPAPAYYVVTNTDGNAVSPSVSAALLVPGIPTIVELSLGDDLIAGAVYNVSAVGVPAQDASATPAGSNVDFRWGTALTKENVEPINRDRELLLYGIDLLWNGLDFQETATGDLDRVSGTANVTKALYRGAESDELPWDPTYGAKMREFVDSPSIPSGTLKGSFTAQILRDPRVKSANVTYKIEDEKTFLFADPVLVSGETVDRVSIAVPNQ